MEFQPPVPGASLVGLVAKLGPRTRSSAQRQPGPAGSGSQVRLTHVFAQGRRARERDEKGPHAVVEGRGHGKCTFCLIFRATTQLLQKPSPMACCQSASRPCPACLAHLPSDFGPAISTEPGPKALLETLMSVEAHRTTATLEKQAGVPLCLRIPEGPKEPYVAPLLAGQVRRAPLLSSVALAGAAAHLMPGGCPKVCRGVASLGQFTVCPVPAVLPPLRAACCIWKTPHSGCNVNNAAGRSSCWAMPG